MVYFYSCMAKVTGQAEMYSYGACEISSQIKNCDTFEKVSKEIKEGILEEFQKNVPDLQSDDITFIAFNRL